MTTNPVPSPVVPLAAHIAAHARRASEAVARTHRQRAFQHHEDAGRPLSRPEQPLAAAVLPTFAKPLDARDVSLAEYGKGLIAAPRDDVLVWVHLDMPVVMGSLNRTSENVERN
jgi:hypothetical protein